MREWGYYKMLVWIPSASHLLIKTGHGKQSYLLTSLHSVLALVNHRSKVTALPVSTSKQRVNSCWHLLQGKLTNSFRFWEICSAVFSLRGFVFKGQKRESHRYSYLTLNMKANQHISQNIRTTALSLASLQIFSRSLSQSLVCVNVYVLLFVHLSMYGLMEV